MGAQYSTTEQMMRDAKEGALCILPSWVPVMKAKGIANDIGRSDLVLANLSALEGRATSLRGLEFSEIVFEPSIILSDEQDEGYRYLLPYVRNKTQRPEA